MNSKVADRVLRRLKGFTEALESGEDIAKRFTCRQVELNLGRTNYPPQAVKGVRKLLGASQGVFASFLGVSAKTVCSWEQGINEPSDMTCRFLDEIRLNPPYWRKRLGEAVGVKRSKAV